MSRLIKFALGVASVCYPFVLFFADKFSACILSVLAFLWGLRGVFAKQNERIACFLAAGFFVLCLVLRSQILAFLYPSLVSLAFLAVFAFSLNGEAVITKLARLKEPNLDAKGVSYTRNLTKIWCAFFIFNGALSLFLTFLEDKIYWSVYSGAVSYMLMGALFGGEMMFRKFILKKADEI